MRFLQVTIAVRDLEESVNFYRDVVGLPVKRRFQGGPDTEIVFLGEGETDIELLFDRKNEDFSVGSSMSIGFETESADELIASLRERGVKVLSGIIQPNPSVRFFFAEDPNGVRIEFVERVKTR
ncbi:MAG: VOC family protein [Synergistaceae bacterium]|jgi:lactoylglutathione lyase|nr:VOC family protein [Synergistaceae bacterium]